MILQSNVNSSVLLYGGPTTMIDGGCGTPLMIVHNMNEMLSASVLPPV